MLNGYLSLGLGDALVSLEESERQLFVRLGAEILGNHGLGQVTGDAAAQPGAPPNAVPPHP